MFLVFAFIAAVICGAIASHKGRSVVAWALLGFLFGIFALIIVAVLPNLAEQAARDNYVNEENRRLREQLRQERIKGESFRQHATARLDAHDNKLGIDTRQLGPALAAGAQSAAQLTAGGDRTYDLVIPDGNSPDDVPRWYYGQEGRTLGPVRTSEIAALIRQQVVTPQTLLWSDSMTDWLPAAKVPAFYSSFG
jgi:hypothetical protein